MKKLFVSCMIAFMAICSVGAQEVYIGGGFTVGSEDSEFVFQISPEVGCHRICYGRGSSSQERD